MAVLIAVLSFVLPLFLTLQFTYRLAIIPNHSGVSKRRRVDVLLLVAGMSGSVREGPSAVHRACRAGGCTPAPPSLGVEGSGAAAHRGQQKGAIRPPPPAPGLPSARARPEWRGPPAGSAVRRRRSPSRQPLPHRPSSEQTM